MRKAIPLGFLFVGLLSLNGIGRTFDEGVTITAGFRDLAILKAALTGARIPEWSFYELPGYMFVFDSARAAFAGLVSPLLDVTRAFHLANLLLATGALWMLSAISPLAALTMALLPQFVAHSQNNPKDLPALFVFVLVVRAAIRMETARDVVLLSLAFGLALTTTTSAVLLLPILALWFALTHRPLPRRFLAVFVPVSAATALATWPWLWHDTLSRSAAAAYNILTFGKAGLHVLYLGRVYPAAALPWHYSLVLFVATTPVLYLLAAGVPGRRDERALLGWLWFLVPLAAEMAAPSRYDGVRHLLMAQPGFCLAVAAGLARVRRSWIAFAVVALELFLIHPYANAYLNEAVNAVLPRRADEVFEVEYWGQTYEEGSRWIDAHAAPGDRVFVVLALDCAQPYLKHPFSDLDLATFEDQSRQAWFMTMTRRAMYTPDIARIVQTRTPVFTIRRQRGVLLEIYSNR